MRSTKPWLALGLLAASVLAGTNLAQSTAQKEKGGPKEEKGGPKGRVHSAGISVDEVVERIMAFDKNKDGKVSKDELPERMHHLIALGDLNKDGALDKDEIRKLATTLGGSGERGDFGFRIGQGVGVRTAGTAIGPGRPGPGLDHVEGVVGDLKLTGKKKDQALAAVKAHQENVRKLMDKARAELLEKMKEILSEEELNDFKAALDRPRGPTTFFNVGPREIPKDGGEKKIVQPRK